MIEGEYSRYLNWKRRAERTPRIWRGKCTTKYMNKDHQLSDDMNIHTLRETGNLQLSSRSVGYTYLVAHWNGLLITITAYELQVYCGGEIDFVKWKVCYVVISLCWTWKPVSQGKWNTQLGKLAFVFKISPTTAKQKLGLCWVVCCLERSQKPPR